MSILKRIVKYTAEQVAATLFSEIGRNVGEAIGGRIAKVIDKTPKVTCDPNDPINKDLGKLFPPKKDGGA